jgi:glycosyltransferase involved in cell wall biosynthesis
MGKDSASLAPARRRRRVLFVAPLPPPITGMAAVSAAILGGLTDELDFSAFDFSKRSLAAGLSSVMPFFRNAWLLARITAARRRCSIAYLTLSQSWLGNLRDLAVLEITRRLPQVVHIHSGGYGALMGSLPRLLRRANRRALARVRCAIVLGDSLRGTLGNLVPPESVHAVANFAADELFLTDQAIEEKHRKRPLNVLFLANLLPGKGHWELLRAAARLSAESNSRVRIHLAGATASREDSQRLEAALRAAPLVRYHGSVGGEARARLLAEAHVVCLPTYYAYEGQPLCILEAYASGCSVVTTSRAGIPDVFHDGHNGILVRERSVEDLFDALRCLEGEDPQALARVGLYNARQARRFYTTSRFAREVGRLLEHAANGA